MFLCQSHWGSRAALAALAAVAAQFVHSVMSTEMTGYSPSETRIYFPTAPGNPAPDNNLHLCSQPPTGNVNEAGHDMLVHFFRKSINAQPDNIRKCFKRWLKRNMFKDSEI